MEKDMCETVFLNGEFLKNDEAKISIFDRGFIFGDGVYEVVPVVQGAILDKEPFLERFKRSLREIELSMPYSQERLFEIIEDIIKINNIKEGGVYMQITRGVAPRDFKFPKDTPPTFMAFGFKKSIIDSPYAKDGVEVVTVDDIRWKRRDIKSISLLAQCIAKEQASKKGAFEGWMVEDGFVTEGTSSSAYIIKNETIITRELNNTILPGIRRKIILELANRHNLKIEYRAFSPNEAYEADEAFLSSATTFVLPIVKIDGKTIADGKPGKITKMLRELYIKSALKVAGVKR
jgi:D-alanine transaminase